MKFVRSTTGVGRIVGIAIMVAALTGALIAAPIGTAAHKSDDDDSAPAATDDRPNATVRVYDTSDLGTSTDDDRDVSDDEEDKQDASDDKNGDSDSMMEPGEANEEGADDHESDDMDADGDDGQNDDEDVDDPEYSDETDATTSINVEEILSFVAEGGTLESYLDLYGITEDEFVTALLAEVETHLDVAVESGALTQEQADTLLVRAEEHLAALIGFDAEADDATDEARGRDEGTGDESLDIDAMLSLDVVAELTGTDVADVEAAIESGMTIADFAAQYGVSKDDLVAALVADIEMKVNDAVASGELTQEEAEEFLAGVMAHVNVFVGGDDMHGEDADDSMDEGPAEGDFSEDAFGSLDTIAELTGTTVEDVMMAVQDGRTLVDFAAEHGVSESDLTAAIVADVEAQIAANVESGFLTQAQADEILANIDEIVASIVNAPGLNEIVETIDECAPMPPTTGSSDGQEATPDAVCPAG